MVRNEREFRGSSTSVLLSRIEQAIKKMVDKDQLQHRLASEDMMRMASWLVTYHHGDLNDFFKVRSVQQPVLRRVYTRTDFRSLVEELLIPEYRIPRVIDKVCDVLYGVYTQTINQF